jgi:uncharacterized protein (TIGR02996 family)
MTPDAFMAAICDAPADDGPRLVYADWLEERGDTARAEFIRVGCEIERLRDKRDELHGPDGVESIRQSDLDDPRRAADAALLDAICPLLERERVPLVAHPANPHWLGKPDPLTDSHPHRYVAAGGPTIVAHGRQVQEIRFTFARGFLDRVDATAADLTRHAAAILAAHPVAEFHATNIRHTVEIHRSPGGWTAVIRAGQESNSQAWFWRERGAMLAGLSGLLRQHLPPALHWNAGTQENPDWRPVFRRGRAAVEQAASRAAADIDRVIAETAAANALPSASFTAEFQAEDVTITPAGEAFFAGLAERGPLLTLPRGYQVVTPPQQPYPSDLFVPPDQVDAAMAILAADPPTCPVCGGATEPEAERRLADGPLTHIVVTWRCPACRAGTSTGLHDLTD